MNLPYQSYTLLIFSFLFQISGLYFICIFFDLAIVSQVYLFFFFSLKNLLSYSFLFVIGIISLQTYFSFMNAVFPYFPKDTNYLILSSSSPSSFPPSHFFFFFFFLALFLSSLSSFFCLSVCFVLCLWYWRLKCLMILGCLCAKRDVLRNWFEGPHTWVDLLTVQTWVDYCSRRSPARGFHMLFLFF